MRYCPSLIDTTLYRKSCLLTMDQHCTGKFPCAMLARHIDQVQDNIADYFPVQSCSWAMGQHCTGKQFSCAT